MDFQKADLKNIRSFNAPVCEPEPSEWQVLDGIDFNTQEIVVEVGCGKGDWVLDAALENPNKTFIAIERTKNKSDALVKKAKNKKLENLFSLRADAIALLNQRFPKESRRVGFSLPKPHAKTTPSQPAFFCGRAVSTFKFPS
ncbi:MAG: hypothetical protein H7A33_00915 [Deltaproteobacteria bacterium]|nr:hypothetical protein [Deltaproteobacteria bacterium]